MTTLYEYTLISVAMAGFSLVSVLNRSSDWSFSTLANTLFESHLNTLMMMNFFYTSLYLFYKIIVKLFFKELREAEKIRFKESAISYVLFNWILNLAALQVKRATSYIKFSAWLSIIYYLKIFPIIANGRYEYLSGSMESSNVVHEVSIMILLLVAIFITSYYMWIFRLFNPSDEIGLCLMGFESLVVITEAVHCLTLYTIHSVDICRHGAWEDRGYYSFLTEVCFDIFVACITCLHYFNVWEISFLSIRFVDVMIILSFRQSFLRAVGRTAAFWNYCNALRAMETRFPNATQEELVNLEDDVCAICLKNMLCAKKLPCNHFFHKSCLQQCFERHTEGDSKCPLCRTSLTSDSEVKTDGETEGSLTRRLATATNDFAGMHSEGTEIVVGEQSLFRFSTNALPQWIPFPAFSFEIVRRTGMYNTSPTAPEHIRQMIDQVVDIFPGFSEERIAEDLARTRSVQITIDNILIGSLSYERSNENNNSQNEIVQDNDHSSYSHPAGFLREATRRRIFGQLAAEGHEDSD